MRLLVYGGNGWICNQFLDYLKKCDNINLELLVLSNNRVDNINSITHYFIPSKLMFNFFKWQQFKE